MIFHFTQVQSLHCLALSVTHWFIHWRLDWCDPGKRWSRSQRLGMNLRLLKRTVPEFTNGWLVVSLHRECKNLAFCTLGYIVAFYWILFTGQKKCGGWWCTKIDNYNICPRVCWAFGNSFSGLIAFCVTMIYARNVLLNKKRDTVKIAKIKAKCSNLSSSCFNDDLTYLLFRLSCFQMII